MEKDAKIIIDTIASEIGTLTPHQVTEFACTLSICYGRMGQELATAEMEYAKKWLEFKKLDMTNVEADMKTKATEEYHNKKRLEYAVKGIKETIQALKKRLGVLEFEYRTS